VDGHSGCGDGDTFIRLTYNKIIMEEKEKGYKVIVT